MNKPWIRLLIIGFLTFLNNLNGFSQSIEQFVDDSIEVGWGNVPIDSTQSYFPNGIFPKVDIIWVKTDKGMKAKTKIIEGTNDDFLVEWYSQHLHAMDEPLLFYRKVRKEVYRFTWLRTFDKPMAFRIEKHNKNYTLHWKVLNGAGGYEPGELELKGVRILTESEWNEFMDLLWQSKFWKDDYTRNAFGNDGSEWILEGLTSKKYKAVSVWSPRGGKLYDACNYLISLSKLNIPNNKKY